MALFFVSCSLSLSQHSLALYSTRESSHSGAGEWGIFRTSLLKSPPFNFDHLGRLCLAKTRLLYTERGHFALLEPRVLRKDIVKNSPPMRTWQEEKWKEVAHRVGLYEEDEDEEEEGWARMLAKGPTTPDTSGHYRPGGTYQQTQPDLKGQARQPAQEGDAQRWDGVFNAMLLSAGGGRLPISFHQSCQSLVGETLRALPHDAWAGISPEAQP